MSADPCFTAPVVMRLVALAFGLGAGIVGWAWMVGAWRVRRRMEGSAS